MNARTLWNFVMGASLCVLMYAGLEPSVDEPVSDGSDQPKIQFSAQLLPTDIVKDTEPIDHQFWPRSTVYLYLRDKLLGDTIADFCKMQQIDVVVSETLKKNTHKVHQSFEKTYPVSIWNQLTHSCGLMWFYDGHVLYVYESGEIQTKVLQVHPRQIQTLLDMIKTMGFVGSNMSINPMIEGGIIVISGAPKMVELLSEIIGNMQLYNPSETDPVDIRVFYLKHAWADDKEIGSLQIPGVATLLNDIFLKKRNGDYSLTSTPLPDSAKKLASVRDKQEDKSNKDKKSETEDIHDARSGEITIDARQNAIIVKDYRRNLALYESIIAKLDVPLELIEIQAAIINVSKSCGLNVGVDGLHLKSSNRTIQFSNNGPVESGFTNAANGLINGIVNGNEFLTAINFLEKQNLSKVLARPSVITMNNLTALMDQNKTFYYEVKGQKSGDMYSISGSTALHVTPHLCTCGGKNQIQLILDIKDESVDPGSSNTKPSTNSSSISTQALVYEGQSVLIGGYFAEDYVKGEKGIPLLKDIPLFGYLFKTSTRTKTISERLFLITPRLIHLSSSDPYKKVFDTPSNLTHSDELMQIQCNPKPIELSNNESAKKLSDLAKKYPNSIGLRMYMRYHKRLQAQSIPHQGRRMLNLVRNNRFKLEEYPSDDGDEQG